MGRAKLEIKKLAQNNSRQTTYSKRRNGIVKKAKELAVLCDIDVLLVMFSPSGKPTLVVGQNSTMEEVIAKFCSLTPQERHKRKLESLEVLQKSFKTTDHVVDVKEFLDARPQNSEELKAKRAQTQSRASMLQEIAQMNNLNLEQTRHVEERLEDALTKWHIRKEELKRIHTLMPVEASGKDYRDNLSSFEFSNPPPSFHFVPSHSDFLVATEDASVKLGKRKCDYFGDDLLVAQQNVPAKLGKRKFDYFGDDFLMGQQNASTKLGKRKCDYFGDDFLMAQQDASTKHGRRELNYFGDVTTSVEDTMYECEQSPVQESSSIAPLGLSEGYSYFGHPSSSYQPQFPINSSFMPEESENVTQFIGNTVKAFSQQGASTSNCYAEPLYDNLLYPWQSSASMMDFPSSSPSQQVETLGPLEQHTNLQQSSYGDYLQDVVANYI